MSGTYTFEELEHAMRKAGGAVASNIIGDALFGLGTVHPEEVHDALMHGLVKRLAPQMIDPRAFLLKLAEDLTEASETVKSDVPQ